MNKSRLLVLLCALLSLGPSYAVALRQYAVEASVQVQLSPPSITLSWTADAAAREYIVRRKLPAAQTWQQVAVLPAQATGFTDANVAPGTAYEYEIEKGTTHYPYPGGDPSQWVRGYGYVLAGINATLPDQPGKVILLVDTSVASSLAADLNLFVQDLTGAGWQVIRRDVSRSTPVPAVRDIIRSEYNADPANVRSVILLGHLPVPYSGAISPDFHPGHLGAWPADVYYAEMDGSWTDHSVNITSGWHSDNHNIPGDGKFDQSLTPSTVELEIGRIDFHDLPSFQPLSETDLLRRYLRKNHQFRHRQFTLPRRGLVRDNFDDISGDAPAVDAWRHFPAFFGPGQIREAGPNAFFSTLANEGFLWSYACGGGDYKSLDAVGSSVQFALQDPQTAFLILHGSYFGDWNNTDNFLRASIGSQTYTLASIWSGLPHWFLHHLALGETLGYSTRLAQNNRSLYQSNRNFSAGEVHVTLIGDPTLRIFPVAPPGNLNAVVGTNVKLSWNPSPDGSIVGYHVYHAQDALGPYNRLTTSPLAGTSYAHAAGPGTHHYMVRASKLETTGSGTFYNPSQGIFIQVEKGSGGQVPIITLTLEDGEASEDGPSNGAFRITRNPISSDPLQVHLEIGGTAQNGGDYQTVASEVTIPANSASELVYIQPLPDELPEQGETVSLSLAPNNAYGIGSPASASLIIQDYQPPNTRPTVSFIADVVTPRNTPTPEIAFTIEDAETPASSLVLRASSANKALFPDDNLTLSGSGSTRTLVAIPVSDELGTAKVTIVVDDGALEASRVFFITVTNLNQPPLAEDAHFETAEDTPILITLAATDPEGSSLAYSLTTDPAFGTLTGEAPALTYTPHPDASGEDAFTFAASDGEQTAFATVTITILPENDAPIAHARTAETLEDTEVAIELSGSDVENADLEFQVTTEPQHGLLSGLPPNLTYTPNTNFFGSDAFEFTVHDGSAESSPAVVALEISPVNDPPQAVARHITVLENMEVLIELTANDPDSPAISYSIVSGPAFGALSGSPPTLSYRPELDYSGADLFTFQASDGEADSPAATVAITVLPVDDPPEIAPLAEVSIRKNSSTGLVPITLSDLDTPVSNIVLTATSLSPALLPPDRISFSGSGSKRFLLAAPSVGQTGTARIQIHAADATSTSTRVLTLHITNTPPAAVDDEVEFVPELPLATSALLQNDYDSDGDPLTITAVQTPTTQGGSVTLGNNVIIYTPPSGPPAADQFFYTIKDSSGVTATALVTLLPSQTPRFTGITKSPLGVLLRFAGQPYQTLVVEVSADAHSWSTAALITTDGNGRGQFEDLFPDTAIRIYRIGQK